LLFFRFSFTQIIRDRSRRLQTACDFRCQRRAWRRPQFSAFLQPGQLWPAHLPWLTGQTPPPRQKLRDYSFFATSAAVGYDRPTFRL